MYNLVPSNNTSVLKETSFDKNQEQEYRLLQKTTDENGTLRKLAQSPPKVGLKSKRMFDKIEQQTQILLLGRTNIGDEPTSVTHQAIAALDDNFLQVFNFPFLEGTPKEFSTHPNGIILTRATRELYFGGEPALGKLLMLGVEGYPVVGVLEDFPENTYLENMVFIPQQMASEMCGWLFTLSDNSKIGIVKNKDKSEPSKIYWLKFVFISFLK